METASLHVETNIETLNYEKNPVKQYLQTFSMEKIALPCLARNIVEPYI